ncbi:AKR_collapsed_G0025980.mRNA.1.CDS.1 [Saccharomyces cerevisiae]|nr:AKR_collapsed_G0025980.mRNA.1.CDS.1 [Saccharomyces cerevisiae]
MAAPVVCKKVPKNLIDQCLRLYHDNLYVIWPMLSYDDLHKLLEEKYDDRCAYWFLVSLSAATLSDLQIEIEYEEGGHFYWRAVVHSFACYLGNSLTTLVTADIFRIMTYYCLHRCYAQFADTRTSYRLSCEAVGLIKIAGIPSGRNL